MTFGSLNSVLEGLYFRTIDTFAGHRKDFPTGAADSAPIRMGEEFNVNQYWLKRAERARGRNLLMPNTIVCRRISCARFCKRDRFPCRTSLNSAAAGSHHSIVGGKFPCRAHHGVDLSPDCLKIARSHCAGAGNIHFGQYDFYSDAPLPTPSMTRRLPSKCSCIIRGRWCAPWWQSSPRFRAAP